MNDILTIIDWNNPSSRVQQQGLYKLYQYCKQTIGTVLEAEKMPLVLASIAALLHTYENAEYVANMGYLYDTNRGQFHQKQQAQHGKNNIYVVNNDSKLDVIRAPEHGKGHIIAIHTSVSYPASDKLSRNQSIAKRLEQIRAEQKAFNDISNSILELDQHSPGDCFDAALAFVNGVKKDAIGCAAERLAPAAAAASQKLAEIHSRLNNQKVEFSVQGLVEINDPNLTDSKSKSLLQTIFSADDANKLDELFKQLLDRLDGQKIRLSDNSTVLDITPENHQRLISDIGAVAKDVYRYDQEDEGDILRYYAEKTSGSPKTSQPTSNWQAIPAAQTNTPKISIETLLANARLIKLSKNNMYNLRFKTQEEAGKAHEKIIDFFIQNNPNLANQFAYYASVKEHTKNNTTDYQFSLTATQKKVLEQAFGKFNKPVSKQPSAPVVVAAPAAAPSKMVRFPVLVNSLQKATLSKPTVNRYSYLQFTTKQEATSAYDALSKHFQHQAPGLSPSFSQSVVETVTINNRYTVHQFSLSPMQLDYVEKTILAGVPLQPATRTQHIVPPVQPQPAPSNAAQNVIPNPQPQINQPTDNDILDAFAKSYDARLRKKWRKGKEPTTLDDIAKHLNNTHKHNTSMLKFFPVKPKGTATRRAVEEITDHLDLNTDSITAQDIRNRFNAN